MTGMGHPADRVAMTEATAKASVVCPRREGVVARERDEDGPPVGISLYAPPERALEDLVDGKGQETRLRSLRASVSLRFS